MTEDDDDSDLKRYGRLIEELENHYTKGNDNYPRNMVKSYQLLNEYKNWNPRATLPDSSGVTFFNRVIIINLHSEHQNGRRNILATIVVRKDTSGPNVRSR